MRNSRVNLKPRAPETLKIGSLDFLMFRLGICGEWKGNWKLAYDLELRSENYDMVESFRKVAIQSLKGILTIYGGIPDRRVEMHHWINEGC